MVAEYQLYRSPLNDTLDKSSRDRVRPVNQEGRSIKSAGGIGATDLIFQTKIDVAMGFCKLGENNQKDQCRTRMREGDPAGGECSLYIYAKVWAKVREPAEFLGSLGEDGEVAHPHRYLLLVGHNAGTQVAVSQCTPRCQAERTMPRPPRLGTLGTAPHRSALIGRVQNQASHRLASGWPPMRQALYRPQRHLSHGVPLLRYSQGAEFRPVMVVPVWESFCRKGGAFSGHSFKRRSE